MKETCKECGAAVEEGREFNKHIRTHKLTKEKYYRKYFPKFDLRTGEEIPFKDRDQYLNADFISKTNMKLWLNERPRDEVRDYCKKLIQRRQERKGLIWAPTEIEMITSKLPSIHFYQKHFDYYELCQSIGLLNKMETCPQVVPHAKPNGEAKIYIDTREQKPLIIDHPTDRKTLKFGDYCLSDKRQDIRIERKSLVDLISSMCGQNYERAQREVEKASQEDCYLIYLIEDKLPNLMAFPFLNHISKKIKVTPEYVTRNIRDLIQQYDNVQFAFSGGRVNSARLIKRILFSGDFFKRVDLQLLISQKRI